VNRVLINLVGGAKSHREALLTNVDRRSSDCVQPVLIQDEHHPEFFHVDPAEFFVIGLRGSERIDIVLLLNNLVHTDDEVED
jgi:hypothetical protein